MTSAEYRINNTGPRTDPEVPRRYIHSVSIYHANTDNITPYYIVNNVLFTYIRLDVWPIWRSKSRATALCPRCIGPSSTSWWTSTKQRSEFTLLWNFRETLQYITVSITVSTITVSIIKIFYWIIFEINKFCKQNLKFKFERSNFELANL